MEDFGTKLGFSKRRGETGRIRGKGVAVEAGWEPFRRFKICFPEEKVLGC